LVAEQLAPATNAFSPLLVRTTMMVARWPSKRALTTRTRLAPSATFCTHACTSVEAACFVPGAGDTRSSVWSCCPSVARRKSVWLVTTVTLAGDILFERADAPPLKGAATGARAPLKGAALLAELAAPCMAGPPPMRLRP